MCLTSLGSLCASSSSLSFSAFLSFSLSVEMCFFVFLSIYMCQCFFLYCSVFARGSFHVWPRVSLGISLVMFLWISLSLFLFLSLSLCLSLCVPPFLFLSWALSVGLDLSRLQHVQHHLCCTHNEFRHSLNHPRLFFFSATLLMIFLCSSSFTAMNLIISSDIVCAFTAGCILMK